jgi:hypothetical protein
MNKKTFTEVENYITENKLEPSTASYLRKIAGYKKDDSKKEIEPSKSVEAMAKIEEAILNLSTKTDATPEDIKTIENDIFTLLDNNTITKTKGLEYLTEIKIPTSQILAADTEERYTSYNGWNAGGIKMRAIVDDMIKNAGYITDVEEQKNRDREGIARIKLNVYGSYRENLTNVVDSYSREKGGALLVDGKPLDTNQALELLTDKQKKELFKRAQKETLATVARFEYNIEKTEDKTTTQLQQEIEQKQNDELYLDASKSLGLDKEPDIALEIFKDNLSKKGGNFTREFREQNKLRKNKTKEN